MKKILLLIFVFLLVAISIYIFTSFSSGQNVVEFEGILTRFGDNTAIADAALTVGVDDYTIVTVPGWGPRVVVGESDIRREDVGKRVKVRAKRVDGKNFTLIGDTSYYIRLAQ